MIVGCNAYGWTQWAAAQGKAYNEVEEEAIRQAAAAGIESWEPSIDDEAHAERLATLLPRHGMAMVSYHDGPRLFTDDWEQAIQAALQKARWAKALGARIVCCNPDPVNWQGALKPDDALRTQNRALATFARELRLLGLRLAYHYHLPELGDGATEFLSAMPSVPDGDMGLCLDAQWAYRACGNRALAPETHAKLFAHRMVSLHVRQSTGGVWAETLCAGDIDYKAVFEPIRAAGFDDLVVVEIAREPGTPETMTFEEATRRSVAWLRDTWA